MSRVSCPRPAVPAYPVAALSSLALWARSAPEPSGSGAPFEFFGWAARKGMDTNPAQPAQGVCRRNLHGGNRGTRTPGARRQQNGVTARRDEHPHNGRSLSAAIAYSHAARSSAKRTTRKSRARLHAASRSSCSIISRLLGRVSVPAAACAASDPRLRAGGRDGHTAKAVRFINCIETGVNMQSTVAGIDRQPQASAGNASQGVLPLLGLVTGPQLLPSEVVARGSFSGMLVEAARHSGLDDQDIAEAMSICAGYMSRFMRGVAHAQKLAKLPPDEQRAKVEQLLAAGEGEKPHARARAQRAVVEPAPRVRSRKEIAAALDAARAFEVRATLEWVLGRRDAMPAADLRPAA